MLEAFTPGCVRDATRQASRARLASSVMALGLAQLTFRGFTVARTIGPRVRAGT